MSRLVIGATAFIKEAVKLAVRAGRMDGHQDFFHGAIA